MQALCEGAELEREASTTARIKFGNTCEEKIWRPQRTCTSATSRKSSRREEENEDDEEKTSAEREGASENLSESGRSKTPTMMWHDSREVPGGIPWYTPAAA